MENIGILFFVIVLFFGCQISEDSAFQSFYENFQKEKMIEGEDLFFSPTKFMEEGEVEKHQVFYQKKLNSINDFVVEELNEENRNSLQQLKKDVEEKAKFFQQDLKTDPTVYSIFQILKTEVQDSSQTDEDQFLKIILRLEQVPIYFSKAKQLIQNPVKDKLELAIEQFSQDYFYLKNKLPSLIRKPDILKEAQIDFSQKNEKAQIALKDFMAFLNSQMFEQNFESPTSK